MLSTHVCVTWNEPPFNHAPALGTTVCGVATTMTHPLLEVDDLAVEFGTQSSQIADLAFNICEMNPCDTVDCLAGPRLIVGQREQFSDRFERET